VATILKWASSVKVLTEGYALLDKEKKGKTELPV
jgi:hypothetical protein